MLFDLPRQQPVAGKPKPFDLIKAQGFGITGFD